MPEAPTSSNKNASTSDNENTTTSNNDNTPTSDYANTPTFDNENASTSDNENIPISDNENTSSHKKRRTFEEISTEEIPYPKRAKMTNDLQLSDDDLVCIDSQKYTETDNIWMVIHALKLPHVPMWVGFNSRTYNSDSSEQIISYLTPIKASTTSTSIVLETMLQSKKKIAEELQQPSIQVTYDLAIAKVALQIQATETPKFDNLFIHLGPFYIMMAYFKAIGKVISDCGLTNVKVESNLLANGSVNGFLDGKHFNRCKRLHPLVALGLEILHFESFLQEDNMTLTDDMIEEVKRLQNCEISSFKVENEDLKELMNNYDIYKEQSLNGKHGKTQNYARWTVKYYANLLRVAETHPDLFDGFQQGYLGIKRTTKPFSRQPIYLVLEQTINSDAARRLTGVIHFTNSISARQSVNNSKNVVSNIHDELSCPEHEADTKVIYHVCNINYPANIVIRSVDTDIIAIMLGHMHHLRDDSFVWILTGTGNNLRYVDLTKVHSELRESMCQSLPGFHAITRCDYNPPFVRKGKLKPYKLLKNCDEFQKAFMKFGNSKLLENYDKQENVLNTIQRYICNTYSVSNIIDVDIARFQMFIDSYTVYDVNEAINRKKLRHFDAGSLPPCKKTGEEDDIDNDQPTDWSSGDEDNQDIDDYDDNN
ncbi:hypothetical protein EVAR_89325_1 [Eumeta japonica]|uniref:Uncharacterized protein n=1 Tax=Eumeta variegata TaxID=151549 RepID=A0A4C1YXD9_EUMVA|nr:hypothetical protein EVAR_89325_1 [Eumeta japonica]